MAKGVGSGDDGARTAVGRSSGWGRVGDGVGSWLTVGAADAGGAVADSSIWRACREPPHAARTNTTRGRIKMIKIEGELLRKRFISLNTPISNFSIIPHY